MAPEKRRDIASKGGKAAHARGKAHTFTSDEASEAGRKGGAAVLEKYGPRYYSELARKGGAARQHRDRAVES
jgi:general stress protein YciG